MALTEFELDQLRREPPHARDERQCDRTARSRSEVCLRARDGEYEAMDLPAWRQHWRSLPAASLLRTHAQSGVVWKWHRGKLIVQPGLTRQQWISVHLAHLLP